MYIFYLKFVVAFAFAVVVGSSDVHQTSEQLNLLFGVSFCQLHCFLTSIYAVLYCCASLIHSSFHHDMYNIMVYSPIINRHN